MSRILLERNNGISYIYFNRPERYNALDQETLYELLDVINQVENNDDRIVIFSGKGKAFCAGGDIGMMEDFGNTEFFNDVMKKLEKIALKLYMMPKIVISAINGSAAGLGLSIALNADYIIAEQGAKLGMLFIGIGLAPDGGGHFLLQERLGTHQAKQFMWSNKQVQAKEAQSMGLVDFVTENNALDYAANLGQKLQASPLVSMIKTKMMYHSEKKDTLVYYLVQERKTQTELRKTRDHKEGVQAFVEKRKPVFHGE